MFSGKQRKPKHHWPPRPSGCVRGGGTLAVLTFVCQSDQSAWHCGRCGSPNSPLCTLDICLTGGITLIWWLTLVTRAADTTWTLLCTPAPPSNFPHLRMPSVPDSWNLSCGPAIFCLINKIILLNKRFSSPAGFCWNTDSPKGHRHHLLEIIDKWTFRILWNVFFF